MHTWKFLHLTCLICGVTALTEPSALDSSENNATSAIGSFFDEYFEWKYAIYSPEEGMGGGYQELLKEKLPVPRLNDLSLEFIDKVIDQCHDFKNRSEDYLAQPQTSAAERKFLKLVQYEADTCIRGYATKGYLLGSVNHMWAIQNSIYDYFEKNDTLKYNTLEDYKNNLNMLASIPRHLQQTEDLLREGVRNKITYANESLYKAKAQFESLQVENVEDSKFYKQFGEIRANIPDITDEEAEAVQDNARIIILEAILPAFKKLEDYVFGEYQDHLRPGPGVSNLPNGQAFYQTCIDYHTSLRGVDANQIHQIGLEEVALLRSQAVASAAEVGLGNMTFEEVVEHFREDPSVKFETGNETIQAFMDAQARINLHLETLFSDLILTDDIYELEIRPVPVGKSGLAYYEQANYDKTRKGAFYINTQNPNYWSPIEVTATTLHEGNPGHHLQLTVANNKKDVPIFATVSMTQYSSPSGPGGYGSYIEGWALYAESLGHQMDGIYDRDNQIFGYYSLNLLRASRLVVDTGIHALGWTRQQAVDYLVTNTFQNVASCESEIDRYITWPGQALAYKMGERKIKETLEAMKEMGDTDVQGFDLKAFHDAVLNCNGPLNELEGCVRTHMTGVVGVDENKEDLAQEVLKATKEQEEEDVKERFVTDEDGS